MKTPCEGYSSAPPRSYACSPTRQPPQPPPPRPHPAMLRAPRTRASPLNTSMTRTWNRRMMPTLRKHCYSRSLLFMAWIIFASVMLPSAYPSAHSQSNNESPRSPSIASRARTRAAPLSLPNLSIVTYNCTAASSLKAFLRGTGATVVAAQELHAPRARPTLAAPSPAAPSLSRSTLAPPRPSWFIHCASPQEAVSAKPTSPPSLPSGLTPAPARSPSLSLAISKLTFAFSPLPPLRSALTPALSLPRARSARVSAPSTPRPAS